MSPTVETATIGIPSTRSVLSGVTPNKLASINLMNPRVNDVRLFDGDDQEVPFVSVTVGALSLMFDSRDAVRSFIADMTEQLDAEVAAGVTIRASHV